jgi:hypothetical protein
MADILYRISIDAESERVRELVATKQGVEDWWTAHPVGGRMLVFFGDSDPSAIMEVTEDSPERIRVGANHN